MEKDKLITFATQVYLQSTFVWSAGVYLDEAVANKNTHVNRIFFHIQSMMTASANVSKLLWAQDHTNHNVSNGSLCETFSPLTKAPLCLIALSGILLIISMSD
jgi:hypothetical protein